jgi:hypothetical protein
MSSEPFSGADTGSKQREGVLLILNFSGDQFFGSATRTAKDVSI